MSDALITEAPPIRMPSQNELVAAVLRGWKLVIVGLLAGIWWTADGLRTTQLQYTAMMQVTQAEPAGGGSAPRAGLADLTALALPVVQNGSEFRLYLDSLVSRSIADEMAKDKNLMRRIFPDGWDDATQTWHFVKSEPTRIQAMKYAVYSWLGYPTTAWHAPDGEYMLGFLGYYVKIQQDPKRPYIAQIQMQYSDPQLAVEILNKLHKTADDSLRQKAIKRTSDYIAFLTKTLSTVTIAEHRASIIETLSEQEKTAMMAHSGSAFAADLFDAPWAQQAPSYPKPFQSLVLGAAIGGAIGAFLAMLQSLTARRRRSLWRKIRRIQPAAA